jgi:MFS family permease
MFSIDMNIVVLALPVMGRTFQQTDEAMSWVMLSYLIPLTLLLIPSGLIVTRWQPLATFLVGISGFGIASVLCALAPSFNILLAARAIQGISGALLGTQGMAIIGAATKPHERGRAMGIIGSMGPLGAVTGPGIGGLLLAMWGWPAIFLVNVPVILVAMALASLCLPGFTFGSTRTSRLGQMGYLLRHPRFLGTLLILLAFSSASAALAYLLPFTLQNVHHLDLELAGATLLVPSLGMAVMGPLGGYLTDRFGVRLILPAGWIVTLVGLLALLLTIATPTSVLNLDWRLLLIGLGNGIAYGPLLTFMMSLGPRETLGAASALSNMTRQFGFICGPALVSLLWSWQVAARPTERASSSVVLLLALSLAGLICALLSVRGWSQLRTPAEVPA